MNGTRAQKKAKHEKGDEGAGAEVEKVENGATAFSQEIVKALHCPLTHKLFVDACIAEDGHTYERSEIQRWLKSKQMSPVSKENMGKRLVKSPRTRARIESAIEKQLVDADAAREWHLESAKAEALVLPRGSLIVSIEDHLRRAEEFSSLESSEEIKAMRAATDLKSRAEDLEKEKRALLEKSPESVTDAVAAILGSEQTILEWRELRVGKSKIRVIDDAEEFERLCKRKAPGAESICGWTDDNKKACGKVFVVRKTWPGYRAYEIHHNADRTHLLIVPFDACYLVEY